MDKFQIHENTEIDFLVVRVNQAESNLRKLVEAVERHKVETKTLQSQWHPYDHALNIDRRKRPYDEELYKVLDLIRKERD